jgi:hypothetical protein
MNDFQTLTGDNPEKANPKLTALNVSFVQIENEIEKLINTLTGANATLLSYANSKIEELDAERQRIVKDIADMTAEAVSPEQNLTDKDSAARGNCVIVPLPRLYHIPYCFSVFGNSALRIVAFRRDLADSGNDDKRVRVIRELLERSEHHAVRKASVSRLFSRYIIIRRQSAPVIRRAIGSGSGTLLNL